MSVMESPRNSTRDAPATRAAAAAFASRYRARFGQSCRVFAFLATVSSSRATCFDNGVMSGACALQMAGNVLRQISATAESGTEMRIGPPESIENHIAAVESLQRLAILRIAELPS